PGAAGDVVELVAVVDLVLDGLVSEAVELRAHLTDLAGQKLLVAAAPVGLLVHERALGVHVELPRARDRHRLAEHVTELHGLAGLDELRGLEHGCGLHVVAGAALVGRAPLRGTALAVSRRPPGRALGDGSRQAERDDGQGEADDDGSHGVSSRVKGAHAILMMPGSTSLNRSFT